MSLELMPRDGGVRFAFIWVMLLVAGGFLVRVGLSFLPGHDVDMGCFTAWSQDVFERGLGDFFRAGYFCDYPPFYLYVLWLVGWLRQFVPTELVPSVVKMPAILGDIVLSMLLWKLAAVRFGAAQRLVLLGVLMLYPPFFFEQCGLGSGGLFGGGVVFGNGHACEGWQAADCGCCFWCGIGSEASVTVECRNVCAGVCRSVVQREGGADSVVDGVSSFDVFGTGDAICRCARSYACF
jgi:hypothetical protein